MLRRIGYVVVFVKNWADAMRFYAETLALEVVRRSDDQRVAEFRFPGGGPNLMVEHVETCDFDARDLVGQFVGMSVTASDIEQTYEQLSARGVRFESRPIRQSWGGTLAHFFDPDGNMWSLVDEAGAEDDEIGADGADP